MSETNSNQEAPAVSEIGLESSTYEIIRSRLLTSGKELKARLDLLNEARKEAFGSIETSLLSTEHIATDHNCLARDMVSVGKQLLFGYNVHFGLKSETELSDVFAVYSFREHTFHSEGIGLLQDGDFQRDFKELFRYYKNAEFAKFAVRGPLLFMVFQVGKTAAEIKVFKWILQPSDEQAPLRYVDNRSEHEFRYPAQHDFEWIRTSRDDHHYGEHPHISIRDRVFVETVGGDLTVKIENNTTSGEGIYAEPVDDPDQTLDDAEVYYAVLGNTILLKMRPYQEREFRYIVYNEKLQSAMRLDSVRDACVLLPDDHGLIFPHGYYLQDGEFKTFDHSLQDMLFERTIAAPNGEDFLYVFFNRDSGTYVLLQYNLIEQRVDTPLVCNGWTFFDAGELLCFKNEGEARRRHAIQLWQTPYVGKDYIPPLRNDSFLHKVGNKDIVRGMAECHEILKLIQKEDSYANLYSDIVRQCGVTSDSHFWITSEETFNLAESLGEIRSAAGAAINEFEKVVRVRRNTDEQTRTAEQQTREILSRVRNQRFEHIEEFVDSLASLRRVRGDIISLRDLRYVDVPLVERLEADVTDRTDKLSKKCVEFLLKPASLSPYEQRVSEQRSAIDGLEKETDARELGERIAASASELEMLIEIVSNLRIDDTTQRTTIIDNVSTIFATINTTRAVLKKKRRELAAVEGVAEFNSQMKLFNQAVVNYLDICDAPEKCEDSLTRLMIQLEELEGRFAEFDEFILQLTEKREEVYNAFETRKLQLVEARNKRATSLMSAAERVLKGIQSRVQSFENVNDINGYFASDLMIEKVREIIGKLRDLEDTVKVDDIQSRLKTVREDAVRQLKDRKELFVEGENAVRFGKHVFSVNTQPLDLTTVLRDGTLQLHLTGTNFFEPVNWHEHTNQGEHRWVAEGELEELLTQEVVSENSDVYRAEYLAWLVLQASLKNGEPHGGTAASGTILGLTQLSGLEDEGLLAYVQRFMGPRYGEAYTKGVHDVDAAVLVRELVIMQQEIGLLRFDSSARALALLYWNVAESKSNKAEIGARLRGAGAVRDAFGEVAGRQQYVDELTSGLSVCAAQLVSVFGTAVDSESNLTVDSDLVADAAEYLFCELSGEASFAVSSTAGMLMEAFHKHLKMKGFSEAYRQSVEAVQHDFRSCFVLLRNWVQAFLTSEAADTSVFARDYANEVAVALMPVWKGRRSVVKAHVDAEPRKLVGSHSSIADGAYQMNYNRFTQRLSSFARHDVPRFEEFSELKHLVVETARDEMRLEEFRPRVLTSFVRNRLLNDVYLPLIGDNLAKQIGATGEGKRTDLMGLLLLVSPPGYGKTTLMEYIANRLGLIFMKINGPALGHSIKSLDPEEATNAGAREEVEKLNLAFEMGDNVMIYLDDIQHTHSEFLQKFISLCDAQRRIEGVYKGRARTYDLRGRKVAVVMAGNPYTESGEKFQIPDMLSNRADIYNLGEIIGESADAFEMSYLENSLTSNPVLSRLASRSQQDIYAIIRMANNEPRDEIELEGNFSLEEVSELVSTMKKLMQVRDVILSVNREYIRSAAQNDDYRTEPAFKLQGSYRNMNRIAEKVVPIMNDEEITSLIVSNYENDAQTLTSGTEANLLKFKELTGLLTAAESERWEDIKRTFRQNVRMRGISGDDRTGQVIATLAGLNDGLDSIRKAMTQGVERIAPDQDSIDSESSDSESGVLMPQMASYFSELKDGLAEINASLVDGVRHLEKSAERADAEIPENSAAEPGIESVADAGDPAVDSQKITIVNKIPPTVVAVLKQQFKLMNAWMQPIHEATQDQRRDNRQLLSRLDECTDLYRQLIARIEQSK